MIYIESLSTDPYYNLALEEYVFSHLDKGHEYFMLWQNAKTIVVGKFQNTAEEINQPFVEAQDIQVARRLSGGGAVYHDQGNLNFTFVVDRRELGFDFKMFTVPVLETLQDFGIEAEFSGRNDITIDGLKFSGNAQYARHGRVMHHGCIMLDSNLTNVADALRVKEAKFESKSVKSVRSRVTTINAHAPRPIGMEEFKNALKERVMGTPRPETYFFTEEDKAAIQKLRDEKYATWAWNYGASPAYNMRRELKFPGGLLTALLQVKEGRIESVRFYGDFFANKTLDELEQALAGLALNEDLREALEAIHPGRYISGLTEALLAELLV